MMSAEEADKYFKEVEEKTEAAQKEEDKESDPPAGDTGTAEPEVAEGDPNSFKPTKFGDRKGQWKTVPPDEVTHPAVKLGESVTDLAATPAHIHTRG